MKEGRPSQTAAMVAFLRALADLGVTSVPGFRDPTARHLLAPPWSHFYRYVERRLPRLFPKGRQGLVVGVDQIVLRTLLIDSYLRDALAQGVRQVVILGAGLDGRAYRIPELEGVEVFEVDHPATQSFKKARLSPLTPVSKQLHFVTVNFEKDSLDAALQQAGHRASEPTFFIWEGVVMYLTDAAVRSTLRVVSSRSAPGSGIVINYSTHGMGFRAMNLLLRFWSEPMIGLRTPDAMRRLLEEVDFEAVEDTGVTEWAQRFHARSPDPQREFRFRMVLARPRSSDSGRGSTALGRQRV